MAYTDFPDSGFFGDSVLDAITGTTAIFNMANDINAALYLSSWSASISMGSDAGTYDSGNWASNKSAQSPDDLTSPSMAVVGNTHVRLTSTDTELEWTSLDETDCGLLIYNNTLSPKRGLCVINFGADKVVAGTLTVSKDTTYGWGSILF